ncbi:hypothetical protein [uncultured Chryseobacterium sp.]|uniref:hypothetical protein n=1 Tax=uncultured Chryseobacterium sp. TaxID=259322 RepID=UPI0025DDEF22|nr:hypothetical protein [uncultured Chryseobacterium sp.]
MALEIIENYIDISESSDLQFKIDAENANNAVKQMADNLRKSDVIKLDPNDGRKAIITLTADIDKLVLIDRQYTFL